MNIKKFDRNNYFYGHDNASGQGIRNYSSIQLNNDGITIPYDTTTIASFNSIDETLPIRLNFNLDDNNEIIRVNTLTRTISVNNNIEIEGHDFTINQYLSTIDAMRYTIATLRDENRSLHDNINELRERMENLETQNSLLNAHINILHTEVSELGDSNGR